MDMAYDSGIQPSEAAAMEPSQGVWTFRTVPAPDEGIARVVVQDSPRHHAMGVAGGTCIRVGVANARRTMVTDTPLDWRHGHGLPGGGPWLILADCPSRLHNTANAARGQGKGKPKCRCPHALVSVAEKRAVERAAARKKGAERVNLRKLTPIFLRNSLTRMPELPNAACKTSFGQHLFDQVQSKALGSGPAARRMCMECPELHPCGMWILKAEDPPGSWGNYYAGMNAAERREIRRHEQQGSHEQQD